MIRALKFFIGLISLLSVLCLTYGFCIEPRLLKVRLNTLTTIEVDSPLKIVLVSDIHIGGLHVPPKRVKDLVTVINAQSPDLVLIAGDFVDGHKSRNENSDKFNAAIESGMKHLGDITAPMGTYTVLGNHDSWYGNDVLQTFLTQSGIRILTNESAAPREGLCLVGLADADTGHEDPKAFETCTDDDTKIALMHSPDSFPVLPMSTDLAFAGHTHGGQINLPLLGRAVTASKLGKPYAYGLVDYNGIPVWITAGVGTSIMPARFRSSPEIVVLTLK